MPGVVEALKGNKHQVMALVHWKTAAAQATHMKIVGCKTVFEVFCLACYSLTFACSILCSHLEICHVLLLCNNVLISSSMMQAKACCGKSP